MAAAMSGFQEFTGVHHIPVIAGIQDTGGRHRMDGSGRQAVGVESIRGGKAREPCRRSSHDIAEASRIIER